ncbi:1,2-phenylacetyl-CoA epoxidase subunit PaaC, partial [Acinetobacter baumannii]
GDFAQTIVRQWLMDHYHLHLFTALAQSSLPELSALAVKSLKEVKYHIRFSTSWMERLSLSTDEAHQRVQDGLDNLWRFTAELFELSADEKALVAEGVIPDFSNEKEQWNQTIADELKRFELNVAVNGAYRRGAKQGLHTEHLGYLLAEMQCIQRTYPGMTW